MKEVIKALNVALLNLSWWKKPILILLYFCYWWRLGPFSEEGINQESSKDKEGETNERD